MNWTCPRCGRKKQAPENPVCDYCHRLETVCFRYERVILSVAFIISAILIYLTLPRSIA